MALTCKHRLLAGGLEEGSDSQAPALTRYYRAFRALGTDFQLAWCKALSRCRTRRPLTNVNGVVNAGSAAGGSGVACSMSIQVLAEYSNFKLGNREGITG